MWPLKCVCVFCDGVGGSAGMCLGRNGSLQWKQWAERLHILDGHCQGIGASQWPEPLHSNPYIPWGIIWHKDTALRLCWAIPFSLMWWVYPCKDLCNTSCSRPGRSDSCKQRDGVNLGLGSLEKRSPSLTFRGVLEVRRIAWLYLVRWRVWLTNDQILIIFLNYLWIWKY